VESGEEALLFGGSVEEAGRVMVASNGATFAADEFDGAGALAGGATRNRRGASISWLDPRPFP
jgi:hypothetical protein